MLRIGPAGWDYQDWQGVVYPPGVKGTDRLTFLAALFEAVEINVTFYRPVAPQQTLRWSEAVATNPDFRFTAKLLNIFTHERQLPDREVGEFQSGLLPLLHAGRLGALLAQFPYSFHHTEENRAYLAELKKRFQDFPVAVEVRHRSWQQKAVREFLAEIGLDFCNIDQPQVSYSLGKTVWATGPVGYLRAHGRHKEKWFEFGEDREARYDYLYGPEELEELGGRVRELGAKAQEVYVIFNNHPRGQAVANALEMAHILTGRLFPLPDGLVRAFPRLTAVGRQ
jgi:uncharacterized protein YecE (DUF72 family)|uniref:DUF72 domain-containing protein n=1 Tax=Desulfobacca acetoxidans TaxID=60893 RepID=A0A7V6DPG8_9BACT